eukprot:gene4448-2308_t
MLASVATNTLYKAPAEILRDVTTGHLLVPFRFIQLVRRTRLNRKGLKLQHRQPRDGQKHHTDYLRLKHVVLPETLNKEFIDAVPVENEASGKVIVEVDQEEFEEI